ncbi:MAG TPA: rhodanese-like domain-containing protein [bacterium]|nr:rhodanese-like domain-containing protein [bacterium]HQL64196.1 rhodanese-like domain-containing protein [bacterium]
MGSEQSLLVQTGILLLFGSLIGIAANGLSREPIPMLGSLRDSDRGQWREIALPDVKTRFDDGSCLFVDARDPNEFHKGHIPGANNIPTKSFSETYPQYSGFLPTEMPLIVYCQGDPCDESRDLLVHLRAFGHKDLVLFPGGWTEWEAAGYPVEK